MNELNQTQDEKPREFTGKHMLAIMVAFFGVIIAVNLGMATIASKTWTGLVVKNSYVASQDFNAHLAEAAKQKKLGWQGGLTYKQGAIEFSLADKNAVPITLDTIFVKIGRPAFEQQDQKIELTSLSAGKYSAKVALGTGPWAFSVRGQKGDNPYRLDVRLDVSKADGMEAAK
ncbi:MAG: FixH family protein [Rhizobiaceae bacterium]|nr:FixH family protein [Rhizobiaceae bacterium]